MPEPIEVFQTVVLTTVKPSQEVIDGILALVEHDEDAHPSVAGVYTTQAPVTLPDLRLGTLKEIYGA